ncbi:MAG: YCF48-related protein [Ignavibacterium sp.]|jgi:photosystem II stability/assembly factor-like uncharacterized protein|nr:YCF48-related protein [Ignavibacterium sp.]
MKKVTWLISFVLLIGHLYAQTGWFEQTNPLGFGEQAMIGKVQFVSSTEGWISCGNGGLLHTINAGVTWDFVNPFPNDTVGRTSDPAVSMSWVGTTHGWIIGGMGGENNPHGAIVFYTTNGGVNWQKKVVTNTPGDVGFQIQFVDINTGWLLTYNFLTQVATFLKTNDGGNNWFPFNGAGIFYFVDSNNGWSYYGSGMNGSEPPFNILRTTNGGTDWTEQFSDNTPGSFNGMHFTDVNHGWIVGGNGKVLKTGNGGANWDFVLNTGVNTSEKSKAVFFLDLNNGWISSKDGFGYGTTHHTTDGGASWKTQATPLNDPQGGNSIFSIHFINSQTGWLTGDYGRIAKYTGTTSVEMGEVLPNDFSLSQNYPNPFNPSTSIQYAIASRQFVTLKVYDVLGNEVTTLVNEEKPAGSYQVEFNASYLTSGIYFYKLTTGSFSETKKMMLLK